ncbi:hypothetical protein [Scytonema sp. PRP1]|uniref:hypothetical protein n=1 Tax=Scytonema sp. PRP1 TaxID=3120513 RepID=UPI00300CA175
MASGKPLLFTLEYTSCINIILSRPEARQRRGEPAQQSLFPSCATSVRGFPRPWKVASGDWRWFPSGRNSGANDAE